MRTDRHLAITLRKQGKSYNEISKELGIPESTLGYWLRGNQWSEEIKKDLIKRANILARSKLRLMAFANKKKWEVWHQQCQQEAGAEYPTFKDDPLFVAGLMLYWGEGDKVLKNGQVRLANSDPDMIKFFIKLTLYPDLEDITYMKLWSNMLNIPLSQFKRSAVIRGRHPNRRLSYGICTVEVYSRKLKEKILEWFRLCKSDFNKEYLSMV